MSNHLRKRRKELKLTLDKVARAVGSTKATVMKLERGHMNLTETWMKKLAVPLQCDPRDFIAKEWPSDIPVIGLVCSRDILALYRPLPPKGLAEPAKYWQGLEEVERPPEGGYRDIIALRVQSNEMGIFLPEGSLIYAADPIEKNFKKYLNQTVVCKLRDGTMLIKKLENGSAYGCYNLRNMSGNVMENVEISWCARVIFFKPA